MRKETLPRLFVDEENRRVVVGGREVSVKEMTSGGYRLLRYLYQRAGQLVSWKELYYRGYRGLDEVPRWHGDDGYEDWSSCEGTLHTRMSNLRRAIELDPRDPLYLETVKGSGVILHLPW
jgi:DNA-binding response OmpR family regulator